MENLPPELLDKIIGYLPRPLRGYSLVARSWTYPCQRRLFETIEQLSESILWWKLNKTSPKSIEIFHHVRSLSVDAEVSLRQRSDALARFHHYKFPLFPRLKRMALRYWGRPSVSPQLGVVLAPQNTIEHLTLRECRVTISALVTLINHFPNLTEVGLIALEHEVNNEPTPSLTRPFVKLSIVDPDIDEDPSITGQFLQLRPHCDEATIGSRPFQPKLLLIQRVIDRIPTTIKLLNLEFLTKYLDKPLTLANFPELCELRINSLSFMEPTIISTIASSHIQKITFVKDCKRGPGYWFRSAIRTYLPELDASLRQVADRLTHELPLDVEFRFSGVRYDRWAEWHLLEKHLPRIHEKGRVRVVDCSCDTVLYCSDQS